MRVFRQFTHALSLCWYIRAGDDSKTKAYTNSSALKLLALVVKSEVFAQMDPISDTMQHTVRMWLNCKLVQGNEETRRLESA